MKPTLMLHRVRRCVFHAEPDGDHNVWLRIEGEDRGAGTEVFEICLLPATGHRFEPRSVSYTEAISGIDIPLENNE